MRATGGHEHTCSRSRPATVVFTLQGAEDDSSLREGTCTPTDIVETSQIGFKFNMGLLYPQHGYITNNSLVNRQFNNSLSSSILKITIQNYSPFKIH